MASGRKYHHTRVNAIINQFENPQWCSKPPVSRYDINPVGKVGLDHSTEGMERHETGREEPRDAVRSHGVGIVGHNDAVQPSPKKDDMCRVK
jgi:hypothetical protein